MRFPGFLEEWKEATIGEAFELYSGNTPSRLDKDNFVGDVIWITSGELKEHYIGDTKEHISKSSVCDNHLRLLPVGTFVIAIYGLEADGIRGTGSITTKESTISQACMAFTPKMDISNEFLFSWYKKHGNIIGLKYAQGTKQQNISNDILEKFKIIYPDKNEQEKLTRFIELIDQRITAQIGAIEAIESLITGITSKISRSNNVKQVYLKDLLTERTERNVDHNEVYSVSVSEGVVNQVEYLGRSFAAADTSHYSVAHYGDIIYTKSPTGSFPYGIVKRSAISDPVAVSPLYGVYQPINENIGIYLHQYFCSAINAHNYLHRLIQKGAKNTINITNQRFLENTVSIPDKVTLEKYVKVIDSLTQKLKNEKCLLESYRRQKFYLLKNMFV